MTVTIHLVSRRTRITPGTILRFDSIEPVCVDVLPDTNKDGKQQREYVFNARQIDNGKPQALRSYVLFGRFWDSLQEDLEFDRKFKGTDPTDTSTWTVLFKDKGEPRLMWD